MIWDSSSPISALFVSLIAQACWVVSSLIRFYQLNLFSSTSQKKCNGGCCPTNGNCNGTEMSSHEEEKKTKKRSYLWNLLTKKFQKITSIDWIVELNVRGKSSNFVTTCNYTAINFLPKFLFLQFKQFANALFLALCIIQFFPGLSPFGIKSTAVPLIFIICCSAVREIYEEIRRRVRDRRINYQGVWAHTEKGWMEIKWCKLHLGQAIKVGGGNELPADVLFISSSESGGVGYIETANLDGESSVKVRQALTQTANFKTDETVGKFWEAGGTIVCDRPNKDIHKFAGYLKRGNEKLPISNANMLYRGARLKNTDYIYGITVYTGKNTKLRMNNTKRSLKRSKLARMTNSVMLAQFGVVIIMAWLVAVLQRGFPVQEFTATVMNDNRLNSLGFIFLGCMLLFMGLVPISLYVTLEMVQIIQGLFIRSDSEMYDEQKKLSADVKTFSLNSELGEIRYVMSDKTGTLTQNQMQFKQCSIAGVKYANKKHRSEETFKPGRLLRDLRKNRANNAEIINEFLTACSICHTVNTDKHGIDQERPLYFATSPDEEALVSFAADCDFIFHSRHYQTSKAFVKQEDELIPYELLHLFEFNSDRKRMSVIVRTADKRIRMYCKGADQVILSRLSTQTPIKIMRRTKTHLHNFATAGYRTLCFAMREITEKEWKDMEPRIKKAKVDHQHQQELIAQLAEEMEKNLELIGVSAIEDRLQADVPQTIEKMMASGMRVWILTGDKLETAVNIGNSCRLLTPKTPMFVLANENLEQTKTSLLRVIESFEVEGNLEDRLRLALIIDATCLDFVLNDEHLRLQFLRLALCCSSVICCRCTPLQKASVTRLVKQNSDGCVLAVGDGANDVAMIQEADVGIGIAGEEGMQASLAADYSIAQFRFLDRLLFVHGTLSLFRTSKCILYSIYKNVLETTVLFLFTFYNGRSDQPIADQWTIVRYNIFFTSWPAIIIGVIDRPTGVDFFIKYSQMYQLYQSGLTITGQLSWFGMGMAHGVTLFGIVYMAWGDGAPLVSYHGREDHIYLYGVLVYILLVTIANLKAILETNSITVVSILISGGSISLIILALIWDAHMWQLIPGQDMMMAETIWHVPLPMAIFLYLLTIVSAFLPDVAFKVVRHSIYKDARDAILWKEGVTEGPSLSAIYKPLFKIVDSVSLRHHQKSSEPLDHGYAFSQDDGQALSQMQLISGFLDDDDTSTSSLSSSQRSQS